MTSSQSITSCPLGSAFRPVTSNNAFTPEDVTSTTTEAFSRIGPQAGGYNFKRHPEVPSRRRTVCILTAPRRLSLQRGDSSGLERRPSKRSCSPLIHHYRLASTEGTIRLRRSAPLRRRANQIPRSVSFDAPVVRLSTVPTSDIEVSTITVPSFVGERGPEYGKFLVSLTVITLAITMLQPLLLSRYLEHCTEPRCYKPALAIRESISPYISPCNDFFRYACSGAGSTRFAKIHDSLRNYVLHSLANTPTIPGQGGVEKAAILLQNCMKLTRQRREDIDKIRAVLSAGGLKFPEMPLTSVYSVVRGIVNINLNTGIGPIFRLTVGHNLHARSGYMLYFAPSYHTAMFARYLHQLLLDKNLDVYVRRCAEVIGERGMAYSHLIHAIQAVNRHFLQIPAADPLFVRVKLGHHYPKKSFWQALSKVLRRKFQAMPGVRTTCLVTDGEYAKFVSRNVFQLLEPTKISAYVGLYIVWLLSRLASHSLAYSTPVTNYSNSLKDMWPRCFSDVRQLMPFAAERLYLERHLKASDVQHVKDMVQRITHSSKAFISELYSDIQPSEAKMLEKISGLQLFPFTFPTLHSIDDLNRLYAHLPDQKDESYVDMFLKVSRVSAQYMVSLLQNATANTSLPFVPPFRTGLPHMTGMYRVIYLNLETIVPPLDHSFSLNYAKIGYKIVEQVSELFLNGPNVVNETGSYERVWSAGYVNALRRKYQCFRLQHLATKWSDDKLPHKVLEAIVGSEILFNAYKGFRKEPVNAAHFRQETEQFGLTPEQLFFVGLCINWCQRKPYHHSTAEQLCRFSLPSLTAFEKAFGCPKARLSAEDGEEQEEQCRH